MDSAYPIFPLVKIYFTTSSSPYLILTHGQLSLATLSTRANKPQYIRYRNSIVISHLTSRSGVKSIMIPFTDAHGNNARVPPIYIPPEITPNLNQQTGPIVSGTASTSKVPSRRGRRSNVPPEIRDQTRRLKKQNMERRRRACISDKMNALHNLAMNIIGINPEQCGKVEKADILNLCYDVFEGIANISKDEPELRSRLQKLRHTLNQAGCSSSSSASTSSNKIKMESTLNTDGMTENIVKLNNQNLFSHSSGVQLTDLPIQPSQTPLVTSSYKDSQHKFDDDNKENRIPKMTFSNPLSNLNTTSISSMSNLPTVSGPILPVSSPLPFSISTPVSRVHSNTTAHSLTYQPLAVSQSTPLHYSGKWNLSLNNSDSGFFSGQSTELTSSVQKTSISPITDSKLHSYQFVDSPSLKVSPPPSSNPVMNSLRNVSLSNSSILSPQSSGHLSAFTVPVKRLSGVAMSEQSNDYKRQCNTTSTDSACSRYSNTSEFNSIPHDTEDSDQNKHVWRPYLD